MTAKEDQVMREQEKRINSNFSVKKVVWKRIKGVNKKLCACFAGNPLPMSYCSSHEKVMVSIRPWMMWSKRGCEGIALQLPWVTERGGHSSSCRTKRMMMVIWSCDGVGRCISCLSSEYHGTLMVMFTVKNTSQGGNESLFLSIFAWNLRDTLAFLDQYRDCDFSWRRGRRGRCPSKGTSVGVVSRGRTRTISLIDMMMVVMTCECLTRSWGWGWLAHGLFFSLTFTFIPMVLEPDFYLRKDMRKKRKREKTWDKDEYTHHNDSRHTGQFNT